jgi:EmrB/QacA subfamily drug resistance transporter
MTAHVPPPANSSRSPVLGAWPTASGHGALVGLSLATLLSSLGTSIANVGLPTLAAAFGASFQQVQWVVLTYLLATTTLVVSVGRLGDVMGRRRLLLGGIALFTAASVVCGAATSLGWMIAARAVQGLGAAIMMSLSIALVGQSVSAARTGSVMGMLGSMSAIGTALGPSLGGFLIAGLGWRALFWVKVPLGVLAFLFVERTLPVDSPRPESQQARFDGAGTLLLALTLGAYALAMTIGRGHFGTTNLALILGAACGAALFVLVESRAAAPLIRISMFRSSALSASLVLSGLVATVLMATLVVGPFYLSRGLGLDAARVGLVMSAGPLVAALMGVPAGLVVDRFGAVPMTRIGLIGVGLGSLLLSVIPSELGLLGYVTATVLMTAGYAQFQAANNTAVMQGVPHDQRGLISGMIGLSRNLGLVTGASLMGAVFALGAATRDVATAAPEAAAAGMRLTFGVGAGLALLALAVGYSERARRARGRAS